MPSSNINKDVLRLSICYIKIAFVCPLFALFLLAQYNCNLQYNCIADCSGWLLYN